MTNQLYEAMLWALKFLPLAAIGTLVHEFGHCFMAGALGVSWQLHYTYTTYEGALSQGQNFLFTIAGPLMTWLVALAGFAVLFFVGWRQLPFFAALFSVRAPFNAAVYFARLYGVLTPEPGFIMDDAIIASYLGINIYALFVIEGVLGLAVALYACAKIPKEKRRLVLGAGIPAAFLGYILWMYVIGPSLLP